MLRATGSASVAALLLSCSSAKDDAAKLGEQCLLGHVASADPDQDLRLTDLGNPRGGTWPARCGVKTLYEGDHIAPAAVAALKQPGPVSDLPAPIAVPRPGDKLPGVIADWTTAGDVYLRSSGSLCHLVGDTLECRSYVGGNGMVQRWDSGPPLIAYNHQLVDAYTGAVVADELEASVGTHVIEQRKGMILVDGRPSGTDPPQAVLVRDQLVWWEGSELLARAVGGATVSLGGFAQGASAPHGGSGANCESAGAVAVRLEVGNRIAVLAGPTWQIYDAPAGQLWCHGSTVSILGTHGQREDCTAAGCPKEQAHAPLPDGAVVAPLGTGVVVAWVDELVRVELPSHKQIVAFDGYRTKRTFYNQLRVDRVDLIGRDDVAVLLIHGERELAVKIAPDGQLTALRVVAR